MSCIDGIDSADFASGIIDPAIDPSPSAPRFDISDGVDRLSYIEFEVTPTPVDYVNSIFVQYDTADGTSTSPTANPTDLANMMDEIKRVESGGNYTLFTSSTAPCPYGAYQFTPGTWTDWAPRALGTDPALASAACSIAPSSWVPSTTSAHQDTVAGWLMDYYFTRLGDWRRVAVAWRDGLSVAKGDPSGWTSGTICYINSTCYGHWSDTGKYCGTHSGSFVASTLGLPLTTTTTALPPLPTTGTAAIAGTHYTAISGTLTFAPGEGTKTIQVPVLSPSVTGTFTFSVVLSAPSVGTTIGDGTGIGLITFSGGGGTTPPPTSDPATLPSYTGWPTAYAYVYNQFSSCSGSTCPYRCGGCAYKGACTAFASTGITSCHRYRDQGDKQCYDAKQLWADAGGPSCLTCTSCAGYYLTRVLDYLVSNGAILGGTALVRHMASWSQITSADGTKDDLIAKIKRSVYANGCVAIAGIWYSNWNSSGSGSWPNYIMPDNGTATSSIGHSYVVVGWSNNIAGSGIGGFEIQSSHGSGWANSGRAWLPYSYLRLAGTSPNPWYRYYSVVPKAGG